MLVYKHDNHDGCLSDETHINQEHVAYVTRRAKGLSLYRHEAVTIGGATTVVDKSGYKRIVAWMESKCG